MREVLGDELLQRLGQSALVGLVQVRGRLVQSQDAAVQAERLRQRKSNHQAREHLLPCAAAAAHLHLSAVLEENHAVVVRAPLRAGSGLRANLDPLNVAAFVRPHPQLSDAAVDLVDLSAVEVHERLVERAPVPLQLRHRHSRGLVGHERLAVLRLCVRVLGGELGLDVPPLRLQRLQLPHQAMHLLLRERPPRLGVRRRLLRRLQRGQL
mmetsp:Transcript_21716/g.69944  ORF Transcript_21716/g.69944 Transcript_21716/m.69944 type:complete len:210 (-) Transcript_21716:707-1336(-)